uniref:Uncharacterized protein MANES_06G145000 n=1 Tax=Rhizophora mucronata TaxID=61149 RepID=A0A2P2K8W9_RHIMU
MGLFRRLFGAKKSDASSPAKEKGRRWGFAGSSNTASSKSKSNKRDAFSIQCDDNSDANKHAVAVAAATAAVAEAALVAAQAAAEVVRLTSDGPGSRPAVSKDVNESRRRWAEEPAAVKLQSVFRGYLVSAFLAVFYSV